MYINSYIHTHRYIIYVYLHDIYYVPGLLIAGDAAAVSISCNLSIHPFVIQDKDVNLARWPSCTVIKPMQRALWVCSSTFPGAP